MIDEINTNLNKYAVDFVSSRAKFSGTYCYLQTNRAIKRVNRTKSCS